MTEPEAVADLREGLKSYLKTGFGGFEIDQDDDFVVNAGSARVFIRPLEQAIGQEEHTFVVIWAVTNVGVTIDGELTRYLATENRGLDFGKFGLNEETSSVHLIHTLLADFLNREELTVAVNQVAKTADEYDNTIKARFGGRLFTEATDGLAEILAAAQNAAQAGEPPQPGEPPESNVGVQALFGFLALLAAVGGAIYAYTLESSIWLSLFVAALALNLIGRGVADVVTDPHKVRRALYFLLFPGLATGVLAATYALWEAWWLSTLMGLVLGMILNAILAPRLFPQVHREEMLDSLRRMARPRKPESQS